MKTIKINFLFCIFFFASHELYSQAAWTQLTSFSGTARIAAVSFSIGSKAYLGTGLDASIMKQDFWEYDPVTNAWTQRADFGGGTRAGAVGLSIGNKGYIGLGTATYPSYSWPADWWEYDPVTNSWTQRANFPALGRYTLASFVINDKAYMGTGWRSGSLFTDFWEYNPTINVWTQKANFTGQARQSTTFFAIGNFGYVGLGAFNSTMFLDFRRYDPTTNSWMQLNNFPGVGRRNPLCFSVCNYGYVGLGSSTYPAVQNLNDFWQYIPSTDSWTQLQSFPGTPRYNVTSFSMGNKGYVGTGQDNSGYNNHFWEVSFPVTAAFNIPASVCAGAPVIFTNSSIGANSYSWDFGDNTSATAENPSHTYSSVGSYQVILTASSNCSSASAIQTINVISAPSTPGDIIGQSGGVCDATVSYSVAPVISATNYEWFVPVEANIASGQGTNSINVTFSNAFTGGTISVAASNSCGTSSVSSLTVTAIPSQPGPISGPVSVCSNQNNVIYSVSPVPGAISYTWTNPPGANFNSGQGTNTVSIRFRKKPGNITVRASNACGSGPVNSLAVAMPCRVGDEAVSDFEATLYPNPASDELNIVFYSLSGNESMKIFNAVGETVLKFQFQNIESKIDISALPAGIYFTEIISGEQKKILKLIKKG